MLDKDSKRGKIILAALRLAEKQGWRKTSLTDIAREAKVSLASLHNKFRSKTAILEAFIGKVDSAVLEKIKPADMETPARDRIFDVLMTRFDVLKPYKGALARIHKECRCAPPGPGTLPLACASMNSGKWMLTAAGISTRGPKGCARVSGLMCLYARVVPVWLGDDDPDLARTMAALDRELRSGERWLKRFDAIACDMARIACAFVPRRRERGRDGDGSPAEQPSAG
ncbi:MAG: TetR/AcrR family transcriptional regulator [Hyphomicrobiales bacterium]|nr:TetR/AcrR family transcriptional regulator [Hyphomicrobiales bacterium]